MDNFRDRPTRPTRPTRPSIKLGASLLVLRVSTGPLRDIVGAKSNIKTPPPKLKPENELLDAKIEKAPTFCKFENFDLHP